jgi:tRNA-splicing ligase RtcB (3'-phosphate/5'-hydroxy nucleic acid ligase)
MNLNSQEISPTGDATGLLHVGNDLSPIQVIGTDAIRNSFGKSCLTQAISARLAPGVSKVVVNPDAHYGHGVPVGCVMTSPTHIYPGPVGVDIKCSMSLLQTNLSESDIADWTVRRAIIREIESKLATARFGPKGRAVNEDTGFEAATKGADRKLLDRLGIPPHWQDRCEQWHHLGASRTHQGLAVRLEKLIRQGVIKDFHAKSKQLGSYGGGNHFGECEIVRVRDDASPEVVQTFGLKDGCVAFLSHCGSRGLGHALATNQFRTLQKSFKKRGIDLPSGDPELVYTEYGSPLCDDYLNDMAMGANFATVNHMLINAIVLAAFQKVMPGTTGELVYFISHNIVIQESHDGESQWVHRKGATRAFPAFHPGLAETPFAQTGHPILLPGNPRDGSSVMVAQPGAILSAYSVNHGAGRKMTRTAAKAQLKASEVAQSLSDADVISNCRHYPIDEAPDAYKDFAEVLRSVELAGLAKEVARLDAKFVIKDAKGSSTH